MLLSLRHGSMIFPLQAWLPSYFIPSKCDHARRPQCVSTLQWTHWISISFPIFCFYFIHPYVHMHAYNHISLHSYIPTIMHSYIYTFIHPYIHISLRWHIHTSLHSYIYISLKSHIHIGVPTMTRSCIHTSLHSYRYPYNDAFLHLYDLY